MKYLKYLLLGVSLLGVFYWFQFRPTQIKKICAQATYQVAADNYPGLGKFQDEMRFKYQASLYKICLEARGL